MQGKTLFVVDRAATVEGIAGGLVDLSALGAYGVEIEHSATPVLELDRRHLAWLSANHDAGLMVLGVSNAVALRGVGVSCHAALPNHPMLYLGVNSPLEAPSSTRRDRILGHCLVPGDYSARSGCLAACLTGVAQRGARVVTLLHVPDTALVKDCAQPAVGELGRVDIEWVDRLKHGLFLAGVEEVRLLSPRTDGDFVMDSLEPTVSLVLVGGTCNAQIARTYVAAASKLLEHGQSAPALMLTAASCLIDGLKRGAA